MAASSGAGSASASATTAGGSMPSAGADGVTVPVTDAMYKSDRNRKKWQKRWFTLSNCTLHSYAKDPRGGKAGAAPPKPKNTWDLTLVNQSFLSLEVPAGKAPPKAAPHTLSVAMRDRALSLSFETTEQRGRWTRYFRNVHDHVFPDSAGNIGLGRRTSDTVGGSASRGSVSGGRSPSLATLITRSGTEDDAVRGAALQLQSAARAFLSRREVEGLRADSRAKKAGKLTRREAAVRFQAAWRGRSARSRVERKRLRYLRRLQLHESAIELQRVWRGRCARVEHPGMTIKVTWKRPEGASKARKRRSTLQGLTPPAAPGAAAGAGSGGEEGAAARRVRAPAAPRRKASLARGAGAAPPPVPPLPPAPPPA